MPRNTTPRKWRGIDEKYAKFEKFLETPTRRTFVEAMQETWYYERSINNINYYVDNYFLDDQTAEEIAERIGKARRTGNPDPVRKLDGFGWATATEILSALEPSKFTLLNSRSAEAMEDIGYAGRVPNPRSASLSQYRGFSEAVQEAVRRFPLRQRATELKGEAPPEGTPGYLIADLCFAHHYNKGEFSLDEIQPDPLWHLIESDVIDDQMQAEIEETVAEGGFYDGTREFLRAALRNEVGRT